LNLENTPSDLGTEPALTLKASTLLGLGVSTVLAFGLAFISVWQIGILAPLIGGGIVKKGKYAPFIGACGVIIGWGLYFFIAAIGSADLQMLDQVVAVILGTSGYGGLFLALILLLGGILGALAGLLGFSIKNLFNPHK